MSELPFFYNRVSPTTWVHLSSLLTIAIFFKFSRLWSVRNLDLIALILIAPGLLAAQYGHVVHKVPVEQAGYLWLFAVTLWFLGRTLLDPMMVRRPLLEPNLSVGGLTFLGIALFVFLMANVLTGVPAPPEHATVAAAVSAENQAIRNSDEPANQDASAPLAETDTAPSSLAAATPADATPGAGSSSVAASPAASSASASAAAPHTSTVTAEPVDFDPRTAAAEAAPTPNSASSAARAPASDGEPRGAPPTEAERIAREGPGYPPLFRVPNFITQRMILRDDEMRSTVGEEPQPNPQFHSDLLPIRIALVLLHLSVVIGLVLIGYRHFDNVKTGIAAAVLYLMLPYTAQFTGCIRHVLPAAPLIWALVTYRRPTLSGIFMGLACGLSYYPLFLLPLWLSFYWQRGLLRFLGGLLPALGVLVGILAFSAPGREAFLADVQQTFGWIIPQMQRENFEGFWSQSLALLDPVYRMPILAAFVALSATMTIWPAQKNLGSLMSCSAALMLATQFWDAHRGGLFLGWYLPLLLLTIFRPNLEDRVALSVLGESWFPKRRTHSKRIGRAA